MLSVDFYLLNDPFLFEVEKKIAAETDANIINKLSNEYKESRRIITFIYSMIMPVSTLEFSWVCLKWKKFLVAAPSFKNVGIARTLFVFC